MKVGRLFFSLKPHRSPSFVWRWAAINNITTIHISQKRFRSGLSPPRKPTPSPCARWPGWCITLGFANLVLHARAQSDTFPGVFIHLFQLFPSVDALFFLQKCIIFPAKRARFSSLFWFYFLLYHFFSPWCTCSSRKSCTCFGLGDLILLWRWKFWFLLKVISSSFVLQSIVCKLCFNICLLYSFATLSGGSVGVADRVSNTFRMGRDNLSSLVIADIAHDREPTSSGRKSWYNW